MKKLRNLSLALLLLIIVIPGCQPDETEDPTPTDEREKFVASWTCREESNISGTNPAFNVHINLSASNNSQVLIENFNNWGFDKKPYAEISGNSITIPQQIINASTIKGTGALSGSSRIDMNYTVNDGGTVDSISAVLTKN